MITATPETGQPVKKAPAADRGAVQPSRRERLSLNKPEGGEVVQSENPIQKARDLLQEPEKVADKKAAQKPAEKPTADPLDDAPEQHAATDDAGGEQNAQKTLQDVAAALEIAPKDLYSLVIPMGDSPDNVKTLGELKDFFREYAPKSERMQNLDRQEIAQRTERAAAIRDLENLVGYLPPGAVSPEYLGAVKEAATRNAQIETDRLVQVMPDLKDPAIFQQARADMVAAAGRYGLTEGDVANIMDHRWIMALRDLAKLSNLQAQASGLRPEQKDRESRPAVIKPESATAAAQRATIAKAKAGDKTAQRDAVKNLLFRG